MDEILETVGSVWPMTFSGKGNLRFAWRNDKLHSIACYGQSIDGGGVSVDSRDWVMLRQAAAEFHVPSCVYAAVGGGVIFASWPVHTGLKYPLAAYDMGAAVRIPASEFKQVARKQT